MSSTCDSIRLPATCSHAGTRSCSGAIGVRLSVPRSRWPARRVKLSTIATSSPRREKCIAVGQPRYPSPPRIRIRTLTSVWIAWRASVSERLTSGRCAPPGSVARSRYRRWAPGSRIRPAALPHARSGPREQRSPWPRPRRSRHRAGTRPRSVVTTSPTECHAEREHAHPDRPARHHTIRDFQGQSVRRRG